MDQKKEFTSWYLSEFERFYGRLGNQPNIHWLVGALVPAFEIAALKHFDNKAFTLKEKLKWYYHLLFKQKISYHVDASALPEYDVLLWPSQPKHYALQLPVYRALVAADVRVAFVTNTQSIEQDFIRDKVQYIPVRSHKHKSPKLETLLENFRIAALADPGLKFEASKRSISFKNILTDTLTYREPVDKSLQIFNSIIAHRKPSFVFLGYSFSTVSLAIDKQCRDLGIVTASLQMGRMMYYLFKYSAIQVYYVYGNQVVQGIKETGHTVEPVAVGSLKVEITENGPGKSEINTFTEQIRSRFGNLALVAFSGPGLTVSTEGHKANLSVLLSAIKQHPDVYFIIKFHGKDKREFYTEILPQPNVYLVDQDHEFYKYDIMHLIRRCDCLISGASTTLLEAAYWKKGAISVDAGGEMQHIDLLKEKFIYSCRDTAALNEALDSVIRKDGVFVIKQTENHKYLEQAFTISDTQPSVCVAQDVKHRIQAKGNLPV